MTFWQSMWSPLARWFGGKQMAGTQTTDTYRDTATASPVSEDSAMQLSAVWACVRLISQTIASLPLVVYTKGDKGRSPSDSHFLAKLFSYKPNRYQTRYEFFEYQISNLVLHGNCYAKIQRIGGEIVGLMPLAARQVEVQLVGGKVVYLYTYNGVVEALAAESVWHVKLNADWLVGRSPLSFGANIFGISQAAEGAVTKIYGNGAKRSGVLKIDRLLTPDQRTQIRANFNSLTTGTDDRLLVLEGGLDFEPVSMSPQDIELLLSRKFQIDEICRWFGVPAILVNQNEGSTTLGSSTGEIIAAFYKLNLRPYLEAIENSMQVHLIGEAESRTIEVELSFEALLRSSQSDRFSAYDVAIKGGFMTPNEARAMEWWPDAEGGDQLFMQGAMLPIDALGQVNPADQALADAAKNG